MPEADEKMIYHDLEGNRGQGRGGQNLGKKTKKTTNLRNG